MEYSGAILKGVVIAIVLMISTDLNLSNWQLWFAIIVLNAVAAA